jgi:hypothetical protein
MQRHPRGRRCPPNQPRAESSDVRRIEERPERLPLAEDRARRSSAEEPRAAGRGGPLNRAAAEREMSAESRSGRSGCPSRKTERGDGPPRSRERRGQQHPPNRERERRDRRCPPNREATRSGRLCRPKPRGDVRRIERPRRKRPQPHLEMADIAGPEKLFKPCAAGEAAEASAADLVPPVYASGSVGDGAIELGVATIRDNGGAAHENSGESSRRTILMTRPGTLEGECSWGDAPVASPSPRIETPSSGWPSLH